MKSLWVITALVLFAACGKQKTTDTKYLNAPTIPKLICKVYDMTGVSVSALPDFSTLSELGTVEVDSLNNPSSNNITPLNTFLDTDLVEITEAFGMICKGKLKLKTPGQYSFYLNSDDGSKLYLNNYQVIDNNGSHTMTKKGVNITLLSGEVDIKIEYFNGYGNKGLIFSMKQPNVTFEELTRF